MAHYAFLDENNIVTEVITGRDENELGIDWEAYYGEIRNQVCKRTSYNTSCNTHRNGGVPFRKNYAGIGYLYDEDIDGFISPRIFPSWLLDIDTGCWEAPEPYPNDGKEYYWDENNLSWEQI
jgi:hypothetical protein